jgi:hypothetical protein
MHYSLVQGEQTLIVATRLSERIPFTELSNSIAPLQRRRGLNKRNYVLGSPRNIVSMVQLLQKSVCNFRIFRLHLPHVPHFAQSTRQTLH